MGNICNSGDHNNTNTNSNSNAQKRLAYRRSNSVPSSKSSRMRSWSRRDNNVNVVDDHQVIHEQALAAAAAIILRQQNGSTSSLPFDRSTSLRYNNNNKKQQHPAANFPRSSSSRARSSTDALLHPSHLLNHQKSKDDAQPAHHFVLVHGGGFGAWCWYKTIALLEESGYKVTPIDLAGSGIHSFDTNEITSLSQYVKPLTEFLEKLADGEKVILVGHDFGGSCISYSMELFPANISKAVFVAGIMLTDGQSALDIFSQQVDSMDLLQQAQKFVYAKGNDHPPTAIGFDREMLKDLLFNQSPTKDIALASVSMRLIPFSPVVEKLSLSRNYDSVRRFYIETTEDNAIPATIQGQMMKASPPEQVFRIKGADHSPFFSKPQALHKYLVEISKIL